MQIKHAIALIVLFLSACTQITEEKQGLQTLTSSQEPFQLSYDTNLLAPQKLSVANETIAATINGIVRGQFWSSHIDTWVGKGQKRKLFWQQIQRLLAGPENLVAESPVSPFYIFTAPQRLAPVSDKAKFSEAGVFGQRGLGVFNGGTGGNTLFLSIKDRAADISAGSDINLAFAVGTTGVTFNLAAMRIDAVVGTVHNDVFIGGGRKTVFVSAGPGADLVIGGAANDILNGDDGEDTIDGGAGNDLIRGGAGNDQLLGGVGEDVLFGDEGDDIITGGAGNDVITGGAGNDQLFGGDGVDLALFQGRFADYRFVNLGNGRWRITDRQTGRDGTDTLDGIERVSFADKQHIVLGESALIVAADDSINLASLPFTNEADGSRLYVIAPEILLKNDFSPKGKSLFIRSLADVKGNSLARGVWHQRGSGKVQMHPSGNIWISIPSNFGTQVLTFGYQIRDVDGERSQKFTTIGTNIIEEGKGWVTASVSPLPDVVDFDPALCSSHCTLKSNQRKLMMTGNGHLSGVGSPFDDVLIGNSGDNDLDGAEGADVMTGGKGNDVYWVDSPADVVVELADEGIDTINTGLPVYKLPANVEVLVLLPGAKEGIGNELSNAIYANDSGVVMRGGAGNDSLNGGKGDDTLEGGEGDDILIGEGGKNTYVYGFGDGLDTIVTGLGGIHILQLKSNLSLMELVFERQGTGLFIRVIGQKSGVLVPDWFQNANRRLKHIEDYTGRLLITADQIETQIKIL